MVGEVSAAVQAYQKGGHANKLKLGALNLLELKVPINEVDGKVKRLGDTAELLVHLNLLPIRGERTK